MATEDIIIRYKADVSQLEKDLDDLVKAQEEIADTSKKASAEVQKSANAQQVAVKKRTELLELERAKLIKLKEAQKLAFTPEAIEKYNAQIIESQRRIDALSGTVRQVGNTTNEAFNQIRGSLNNIAGAFGVAFSLDAIVQFANASVNAFLQAEASAESLKNAIISVGGETEEAYNRLIKQSETLQQTTIFGDDDLQNAQAVLSTFGLTSAQIEELLPKLTDFATVTGTSIVEAANKVGSGLQGAGREFKKFGIDVNASNSELENYESIVSGLDKFNGSAEASTKTLAGAFKQLENDVNNAQEEIGSKLASSFLEFKKAALEGINALLGFNKATQSKVDANNIKSINDQLAYAEELEKKYGREVINTTQALDERTAVLERDQAKALFFNQRLKTQLEEEKKGITATIIGRSEATIRLEKQIEKNAEIIRSTQVQLDYIKGIADKKKEEEETTKRILKLEDLRGKNSKDLDALLKDQSKNYDLVGQSNERLIQEEIDRRKEAEEKAREEYKRTAEARKQLAEQLKTELRNIEKESQLADINLIKPESFAEAVDKIEQLRDVNKQFVDEDINLKIAQAKAQGTLTKEAEALFESIRKGRKDLLDQKAGGEILALEESTIQKLADLKQKAQDLLTQRNLAGIGKAVEQSGKEFENSIKKVEESIGTTQFNTAKEQLNKRFILYVQDIENQKEQNIKAINDRAKREADGVKNSATAEQERKLIYEKASDDVQKITDQAQDQLNEAQTNYDNAITTLDNGIVSFVQANAQALQLVSQILGELTNLYDQYAENRIEQIEKEKEAQLTAIDEQIAKDEELLEQRKITEEEATLRKEQNEKAKIKLEEESAKKVNAIKKKQAQLDKANALFQIALNTFQALADVKNLTTAGALTPLILALAGLQAAAVLAQPIPYRKGSKDTGDKGHMARVGEEGEEIVFMPSNSKVLPAKQTKQYGDLLDAMFDNKLNSYIAKTYVTPALQRQKAIYDNEKEQSFANNISKSIYFNGGLNANDLEKVRKRGQPITNVDEIAKAIVKNLPTYDPYRR